MAQCQTPTRRPIGHFDREDYAIAEWQEEAQRLQPRRWRPSGEGAIELGRGDRRSGGQGDNLADLPPRRSVDAERPDRRRQSPGPRSAPIFLGQLGFGPAVDVFGFALHAGQVGRGRALLLDNPGQKVDAPVRSHWTALQRSRQTESLSR